MGKYTLGVIGAGVMAEALVSGAERGNALPPKDKIIICDVNEDRRNLFASRGFCVTADPSLVASSSKYVLIAVKPQQSAELLANLTFKASAIISIMAGVKIATLKKYVPKGTAIFRIMPNLPATVGHATTAITHDGGDASDVSFVKEFFSASGNAIEIEESKFDAVTSISGSGPAYVFMFADALIKAGINGGLTEAEARALTLDTIIGSATLAKKSPMDLTALTNSVCSKGGTTIQAVNVFNKDDLNGIVNRAVTACRKRSEELSNA